MRSYIANKWEKLLADNDLNTFEKLWSIDVDWAETPNSRRGGWSGAGRLELSQQSGEKVCMYLKRQENHVCRSLLPPHFKVATFAREFRNIKRFRKSGIPIVAPVYFGSRQDNNKLQAILITEALDEYACLHDWYERFRKREVSTALRRQLTRQIAELTLLIHRKGYEHGALYGDHIFIRYNEQDQQFDIQLIDLELGRRHPNRAVRDVARFYKRTPYISKIDSLRFLKAYFQVERVTPELRRFVEKVQVRLNRHGKELEDRQLSGS